DGGGAYARGHLGALMLRADAVAYSRVEPLARRALCTGDDDDVERWMIGNRVVGLAQQPAPARDHALLLGQDQRSEQPLQTRAVVNRPRRRKHLERPREIEDLDVVEDQN